MECFKGLIQLVHYMHSTIDTIKETMNEEITLAKIIGQVSLSKIQTTHWCHCSCHDQQLQLHCISCVCVWHARVHQLAICVDGWMCAVLCGYRGLKNSCSEHLLTNESLLKFHFSTLCKLGFSLEITQHSYTNPLCMLCLTRAHMYINLRHSITYT